MARSDPRNFSRYWQAPEVAGMSLLHADFTTHEYAPHVHDAVVVAATEIGGSAFKSRGKSGSAHTRALLVFNPAEPHSGRMGGSTRWRYRSFYLAAAGIQEVLRLLGTDQTRYFTSNIFYDEDLVARFLKLHRIFDETHTEAADTFLKRELLLRSFGALFQRHGHAHQQVPRQPSKGRAALAPVVTLIHDCYAQRLSLEQMGCAANLTPFQLIGLFNKTFGLTPHAYLTQLRLKVAIENLRTGQAVAEAAMAAGFYDQSALNSHFKRAFGMTPQQYVRAMRFKKA